MVVADRVCCPDALVVQNIGRRRGRPTTVPRPKFGLRIRYKLPKVVKLSKAETRWKYGVWIGSIEASDEHLIGTPLGVVKARAVTALPDRQRFEAMAIADTQGTPCRPPTKHRGTKVRTHSRR